MTSEDKKRIKKERIKEKIKANKKSGKFKKFNLLFSILFGMFLMLSAYLIYNLLRLSGIETIFRYVLIGIIGLIDFITLIKWFKIMNKPLAKSYILFFLFIVIGGCLQYFVGFTINKGLNVVDNISMQKYRTYSTSIVSMKSGNIQELKDISSSTKIGRVSNKKDIEGYILTKELIKKDNISQDQIVDYDDSITMLYDLYENKIDAVFISGSYQETYKTMDKFENIGEETIVLDTYKKKMKQQKDETVIASTKSIKEPFTILLMGVDSTEENLSNSSGLGDSLMLITFNPKTLNATILSIPRDTFVPISCYRNVNSKITHAASGGDSCMITTIENAFDVDINYYVKINFRGLIKLVDALGGIDVDVPYAFCETTMWRSQEWMVYVDEGMQHLNGDQALGLSRNRKTYPACGAKYSKGERNDFVRGQNQQLVINAIINKAKNMDNISQFYNVLEAIGGSMTTNMDRKQILSFYNVFKNVLLNSKDLTDGNDIISMQKMYLNGSGAYIKDGIMSMNLYEFVPSTESLNAIKKAMRVNLELEDEEPVYSFSFSSDEEYTQKVIGKDKYGGVQKYETLPEGEEESSTTCADNEELTADKSTCICKPGYDRNTSTNKCEKKTLNCGENEQPTADNSYCECKSGYHEENGSCVADSTPITTTCDTGYHLDTNTNQCVEDETCDPESGICE